MYTSVLVIHIYSLPNHRVSTFQKFSSKSVRVLVTWILEKQHHHTMTCCTSSKAGVIQLWHLCREGHNACCGTWNYAVQRNFRHVYWIYVLHDKCVYGSAGEGWLINWLPQSPDLTPMDFFFSGVHQRHRVQQNSSPSSWFSLKD